MIMCIHVSTVSKSAPSEDNFKKNKIKSSPFASLQQLDSLYTSLVCVLLVLLVIVFVLHKGVIFLSQS